jgi:hypothetical protein
VKINRAEAVELARAEAERKGLDWVEPITVVYGFWNYAVWTRSDWRGGNLIIRVNRRSGIATVRALTPK